METTTNGTPTVGMGATLLEWTDMEPYEIIRVSPSGKTIDLRDMKADRAADWTPDTIPGGFFGHTRNNADQRWIITTNPDGKVITARLTKRGWNTKLGRISLGVARKFYDYNF